MTLWAIVPVKPLRRAKSRLSVVLTPEERADLSQKLLTHTLTVLEQMPQVERTLVVSRDSRALAIARDHGANTVTERGNPGLNRALVRASVVAKGYGVAALLILPADLPLITAEDLSEFVEKGDSPPVVVIAPDRRGTGTNALLSSPPGLLEYDFGPDSFGRHVARAKEAGARVEICEIPSLGLDLDQPDDLELLRGQDPNGLFGPLRSEEEVS